MTPATTVLLLSRFAWHLGCWRFPIFVPSAAPSSPRVAGCAHLYASSCRPCRSETAWPNMLLAVEDSTRKFVGSRSIILIPVRGTLLYRTVRLLIASMYRPPPPRFPARLPAGVEQHDITIPLQASMSVPCIYVCGRLRTSCISHGTRRRVSTKHLAVVLSGAIWKNVKTKLCSFFVRPGEESAGGA